MTAFSKAFEDVQQLVNTFNSSYSYYMSPGYSEAEARQDFIDNFFIALGWDVRHKEQTNPFRLRRCSIKAVRLGWCFSFTNRMNGEEVFTTF
jgi:hypothetical protein